MPQFFDAAGQAAMGAQAYRAGKLENEGRALDNQGRALDNQGQQIRNNAGQEALAEAIQRKNDDKAVKAAWAKALAEIMAMREAQAPEGGPDAEVDAFYAGKDNPTVAARRTVRGIISDVALRDEKAALEIGQEYMGAIHQRELMGELRKVHKSGAQAITGLQTMVEDGFLPEAVAQQFTERLQEVMEALDDNPEMLAEGAKAISALRAEATRTYLENHQKASDKAEMQALVDRLPPNMKKWGALAQAQLANGADPQRTLAELATRVYGAADPDPEAEFKRPGVFEDSPPWVQERIRGESTTEMLEFLADRKVPIDPSKPMLGERSMTPDEILAALPQWEGHFLRKTMSRHNKTSQPRAPGADTPMSVGGVQVKPMQPRPGGAIGAPDPRAEAAKVIGAPAGAGRVVSAEMPGPGQERAYDSARGEGRERTPRTPARAPLQQHSGPTDRATDAGDKVVRGREREPVKIDNLRKRGKDETPQAYLEYVKKTVNSRGGTPGDVQRALEAAGLTPADFAKKEKPKAEEKPKATGNGVK